MAGQSSAVSSTAERWLQSRRRAVIVVLFIGALLVRLPNLQTLPRFEDEGQEVGWALDIARGVHVPLTGFDAYYGPLFSYLVAGLFVAFGEDALWPRLLVAVAGALTVPAIYVLGSTLAGARAGLVAACLAMTNLWMALFASHYGWSASLAPFCATVTLLAAYVAVTRGRPFLAASAGVLGGLTMQTHPINAVLLAGLGGWYLWETPAREWFRRPLPYAAVLGYAVGYGPMLWMWTFHPEEIMRRVNEQTYAYGPSLSLGSYVAHTGQMALWLVLLALGAPLVVWGIEVWSRVRPAGRPAASRDGGPPRRFLISVSIVPLLLLPLALSAFLPRYLGWFQPVMFVVLGASVVAAFPPTVDDGPPFASGARPQPWMAVTALLMMLDVAMLMGAESYLWRAGATNARFFELRDTLRASGGCRAGIVVEDLGDESPPESDRAWVFFNQASILYTLALEGCRTTEVKARALADPAQRQEMSGWAVVSEPVAAALQNERGVERLLSIDPGATDGTITTPRFRFVLVHVGARRAGEPRRPPP